MYSYSMLLLTASLLLLTGTNFTISGAEPLLSSSSSSADALESSGSGAFDASTRDDSSQRFSSAALENAADGGGGGRALEVARRSASFQHPQWQSASASVHRQHQHPHQQQQLPTLELRPVFLSEHFIRQMSPSSSSSSSSSYGTGGGGGQRAPQYFFKPIPRELVPLSGPFLSRGDETLRARRYTYPTASQSFLRFGRRYLYKRPKETKDTAFLRFGRSGSQTGAVSDADQDDQDQQAAGQQQPLEQTGNQLPPAQLLPASVSEV